MLVMGLTLVLPLLSAAPVVAQTGKDLVVEQLRLSAPTVASGGSVTLGYVVANRGTVRVTEPPDMYTESYYLSTDTTVDSNDVLLGMSHGHTLSLSPGQTHAHSQKVTLTAPPGSYYILVHTDTFGRVAEGNETNNVAIVALTVVATPPPPSLSGAFMNELTFSHSGSPANPFTDVEMTCTFRQAGQSDIVVHGFYDGNGLSTQRGKVWKCRALLPTPGTTWTYFTSSSNSGLHAQSGTVIAASPRMPRLTAAAPPYLSLSRGDGSKLFLNGLWVASYSFNDFVNNSERPLMWDALRDHRVTLLRWWLPGLDEWGSSNNKWVNSFDRYRLSFLRKLDRDLAELLDRDIYVIMNAFSNSDEAEITDAQADRFLKYLIARYGAYTNAVLDIHNQIDWHFKGGYRTAADAGIANAWGDARGAYAASVNPLGMLLTIHHPGEDNREVVDPAVYLPATNKWPFGGWAGFVQKQLQATAMSGAKTMTEWEPVTLSLNVRGLQRINQISRNIRTATNRAVVVSEYGFTSEGRVHNPYNALTPTGVRKTHWIVTMAGATGMTLPYGLLRWPFSAKGTEILGYFKIVGDVMSALPFWEMLPDDEIVEANSVTIDGVAYRTNFGVKKAPSHYLIYSLLGGDTNVTVPAGLRGTRIDPRTGAQVDLGISPGGTFTVILPSMSPPADHNSSDSDWLIQYTPTPFAGLQ